MQRILAVEDDLDIQELLQNFLQDAGYEVTVACDGVEALSQFAAGHFDLVLLDIMLPKIDGYGVCELIRKQSDVPIIMVTAWKSPVFLCGAADGRKVQRHHCSPRATINQKRLVSYFDTNRFNVKKFNA